MILLDTHVLVWLATEPKRLSRPAAAAIRHALRSGGLAVASISLWEVAMLAASGRLRAAGTIDAAVRLLVLGVLRTSGPSIDRPYLESTAESLGLSELLRRALAQA